MAELLSTDKDMAASFLNSVLNQLNWAFSEFIGMIQEVREQDNLKTFTVSDCKLDVLHEQETTGLHSLINTLTCSDGSDGSCSNTVEREKSRCRTCFCPAGGGKIRRGSPVSGFLSVLTMNVDGLSLTDSHGLTLFVSC